MTTSVIALSLLFATLAQARAFHHAHIPAQQQGWQQKWWVWLPDKWARVGRCETGLRWDWNSGEYVSAFGVERHEYARDARWAFMPQWSDDPARRPTPWQQWRTALAHYKHHGGFSGWGCRGA